MFRKSLLAGALCVASLAAAGPASAYETPLAIDTTVTVNDGIAAYRVTNLPSSDVHVNRMKVTSPTLIGEVTSDRGECVAEGRTAYCSLDLPPGEAAMVYGHSPDYRAGTEHQVCAGADNYDADVCHDVVAQPLHSDPPKTPEQPKTPETVKTPVVQAPTENVNNNVANAGGNVVLPQCRCLANLVSIPTKKDRRGRPQLIAPNGSARTPGGGASGLGFTMRSLLVCGGGIGQCQGTVKVIPPKGVKLGFFQKGELVRTCAGVCGLAPNSEDFTVTFVSRKRDLTDPLKPLVFTVETTCGDGEPQTQKFSVGFDENGNLDMRVSELGEALPEHVPTQAEKDKAKAAKEKKAAKKAAKRKP